MGRGAGKTHAAATNTNLLAKYVYPGGYGILVGPTVQHVRETMIEGVSGLIATAPADCIPVYRPHYNRVEWPNGTRAMIMTADNKEGIRGPSLNFGWGDELTKWQHSATFDNMFRAIREKHENGTKLILTTSPLRAQEWVKAIESRPNTITKTAPSTANPHQDEDHLAELSAEALLGTTKAREEVLGEWTTGESQLWSREDIENLALETTLRPKDFAATCSRRFLSVDPSGGVKDEWGIEWFGKKGKQVILLDDFSDHWGLESGYRRVIELAKEYLKPGDFVLFEDNNQKSGPALLRKMANEAGFSLRVIPVSADKSKYARAEEAFMHCQMGKVALLRRSDKLESQLVEWEPDMKNSPDRGDAFTQAVNHLFSETAKKGRFLVRGLGKC
nr:terminase family protein [Novosphingobium profundi]